MILGAVAFVWGVALVAQEAADKTAGSGTDWLDVLNRWGPWAAFVILIMVGRFVPGFIYDQLRKENAAKDAKIEELSKAAIDKVLPAVLESNRLNAEVMELVRDLRADLGRGGRR